MNRSYLINLHRAIDRSRLLSITVAQRFVLLLPSSRSSSSTYPGKGLSIFTFITIVEQMTERSHVVARVSTLIHIMYCSKLVVLVSAPYNNIYASASHKLHIVSLFYQNAWL